MLFEMTRREDGTYTVRMDGITVAESLTQQEAISWLEDEREAKQNVDRDISACRRH